ncbi:MAG: hypothetical protein ACOYZ6_19050 [Chloroflexota bacterium]
MAEQIVLKREWKTVDLDGNGGQPIKIGDSTYQREWCLDIDHQEGSYILYVKTYKDEDEELETIEVPVGGYARVCLKGFQLKLFGTGSTKYAFPWVLLKETE